MTFPTIMYMCRGHQCVLGSSPWPDNIVQWPICHPNEAWENGLRHPSTILDTLPAHISCEVTARPCCIGIHGRCELRSEEFCRWVKGKVRFKNSRLRGLFQFLSSSGTFHSDATLCSQVNCLGDVCGMLPFARHDYPDQIYRAFTSLFINAGLIHMTIVVLVQLFLMRDLEKMLGWWRLAAIYLTSGVAGNLASAIFVPYRADVGPSGALFGILGTFVVEVVKAWEILHRPGLALSQLLGIMSMFLIIGLVPWVDNYAHTFGFLSGLALAYALIPPVRSPRDGPEKHKWMVARMVLPTLIVVALLIALLLIFYLLPVGDCKVCKALTCVPLFEDFCAEQNIDYRREPAVLS